MSRHRNSVLHALAAVAFAAFTSWASATIPTPDKVTLKDGSERPCHVIALDDRRLLIEVADGSQQSIARVDVVRIEFGQAAEAARPIVARVHVYESDDEVRLMLDGREIASAAELKAGWVDLAPLLGEGLNQIEAQVTNGAGTWSYRWVIEAGGQKESFACGIPNRSGCRANGATGLEKGTFPAGKALLFVHRSSGEVKLERGD